MKTFITFFLTILLGAVFSLPAQGQNSKELEQRQRRAAQQERGRQLERAPQRGQRRGRQRSDPNALKIGDFAPTFKLKSLDEKSETDLATFKGKRPVVLFFGSYT